VGTLVLLAALVAAGPALVMLAFLAVRALVRGHGRRAGAGIVLATTLIALAYWLALAFGGARNYSDTACFRHAPPGFDEGDSAWQDTGLWPPGLRCRFESSAGVATTYRDGFDGLWVAVAMTAVVAASMGVLVVGTAYARRRFG